MPPVDLPYSQESRALFPLWEDLAEALKEREHVVVARIDASSNDINMSMQGSYPSLCLFPALHAERVRSHEVVKRQRQDGRYWPARVVLLRVENCQGARCM